jgi:hypothetical protein
MGNVHTVPNLGAEGNVLLLALDLLSLGSHCKLISAGWVSYVGTGLNFELVVSALGCCRLTVCPGALNVTVTIVHVVLVMNVAHELT